MEFNRICNDCVEHMLNWMCGEDIVRFGLTNMRNYGIVTRYLETNKTVPFSFPEIISIASQMYNYNISRFELVTFDFTFKYLHNSDYATDVTDVSYIIDLKYIDPNSRFGISWSLDPHHARRSFQYNDKMFRYAMEMVIVNYINNLDFPNLSLLTFKFKIILDTAIVDVWYPYGHLFENAAIDLFTNLSRGRMHYDAIPDFVNGTVLLNISFIID